MKNIVVGELWLASGQSNMMYEIGWLRETDKGRNYLKPYDEIPNLDKLRYFYVTPTYADEPTNYSATTGWATPVSGNIQKASALHPWALPLSCSCRWVRMFPSALFSVH